MGERPGDCACLNDIRTRDPLVCVTVPPRQNTRKKPPGTTPGGLRSGMRSGRPYGQPAENRAMYAETSKKSYTPSPLMSASGDCAL